jgi:predicted RNA polymerase sigma factor
MPGPNSPQILALYELLQTVAPSPMMTLNHAIATAMVHGPVRGLERLKALDNDGRLAAQSARRCARPLV